MFKYFSRQSSIQPVYNNLPKITRRNSENGYIPKRPQGFSSEERDIKISQLQDFIQNAIEIDQGKNMYTADEILTQDNNGIHNFFYFIGRLNPPHSGHIKALITLVEMAKRVGAKPLILLGSGPGSLRTMDNPITFETKEAFIRSVLTGDDYIIQKMTNPAQNVSEYITEGLGESLSNIQTIEINHIAGGKDEDTTKLAFALKSAEKTARGLVPDAEIVTGVTSIEPKTTDSGSAMSSTKVRKDAYNTVLNESGLNGWSHKEFYGNNAEKIYNEILFPLQEIPETERKDAIHNYINNGTLPASSSKRKRGGTQRQKRKNKNKTKTQKKKTQKKKTHRKYK